jgi:hypothetical protein
MRKRIWLDWQNYYSRGDLYELVKEIYGWKVWGGSAFTGPSRTIHNIDFDSSNSAAALAGGY